MNDLFHHAMTRLPSICVAISFLTVAFGFLPVASAEDFKVDESKIPAAAKTQVDFVKDIQPLFEKSCVKCHGGEKPKHGYSMETRDATVKGGKSKVAGLVEGDGGKSLIVQLIAEAVDDPDYFMPPPDNRDKYPVLTKEQVALVRAWIDQGAKWPTGVTLKPAAEK